MPEHRSLKLTSKQEEVRRGVLAEAANRFPDDPEGRRRMEALAFQEGRFDPQAHATRGENSFGVFQMGPALQRLYGLDPEHPDSDRQIRAAADYLLKLSKDHNGDWNKVVQEFNLGRGNSRRLDRGGSNSQIEAFNSEYRPTHQEFLSLINQRENTSLPSSPSPQDEAIDTGVKHPFRGESERFKELLKIMMGGS